MLLHGSLFAGYGGLDLAIADVFGATTAWVSEWDAAASRVLAHHYPDAPNLGDVTPTSRRSAPPSPAPAGLTSRPACATTPTPAASPAATSPSSADPRSTHMTKITITGRATGDAELRFTPSGAPVANFTLVENRRKYDKQRDEWVDDGASFFRCQAWRHLAESVAEHVRKGTLVVVVGELAERQWEDKDGGKRSAWEVTADEVALCLPKFPPRDGQARPAQAPAQSWQTPAGDPWAVGGRDEAPF